MTKAADTTISLWIGHVWGQMVNFRKKIIFAIRVWFWLTPPPGLVKDHTLTFFFWDPSLRVTIQGRWNEAFYLKSSSILVGVPPAPPTHQSFRIFSQPSINTYRIWNNGPILMIKVSKWPYQYSQHDTINGKGCQCLLGGQEWK